MHSTVSDIEASFTRLAVGLENIVVVRLLGTALSSRVLWSQIYQGSSSWR